MPGADQRYLMKAKGEKCHRMDHEPDPETVADECIEKFQTIAERLETDDLRGMPNFTLPKEVKNFNLERSHR